MPSLSCVDYRDIYNMFIQPVTPLTSGVCTYTTSSAIDPEKIKEEQERIIRDAELIGNTTNDFLDCLDNEIDVMRNSDITKNPITSNHMTSSDSFRDWVARRRQRC